MMNFLMLTAAIYIALMAFTVTTLVICTSGWFIKKTCKMCQKMVDEMTPDEE